ncbi:MAG: Rne/Rng family ribonuclease [Thermodesulfovibrionales bacterium]|nr:Rne/Rng family ribonuclease [Thermodesulfovibrionales bacterium]
MQNEILINSTKEEIRVALLEGGQIVEFYVERRRGASLVGNIYKGRIVKVLPGMQSAFVDIGLERAAFLYVGDIVIMDEVSTQFSELMNHEATQGHIEGTTQLNAQEGIYIKPQKASIDELIQEGQELLVQVAKDPIGTKGARVTAHITIPGRYVVFMPTIDHIGVSRRITDESERSRLKEIAERIKPKNGGIIVRTASEGCTEEELKRDLEFLLMLWDNILKKRDSQGAPLLLYSDLDLVLRTVRDMMGQNIERMIIDSEEDYNRVMDFVSLYFPKLKDKIELYDGQEPLFDAFGVEVDISRAMGRKVWLKSGGYIVIDQTEAMTVIDVNTGKFVGKESLEETVLKTNLEAVKEIAYQIRLRNLGGIIIIDFIDMEKPENRQKVFNAFVEMLKKDRVKSTILNISELGLIQMTRKRVRESITRILCEPCPYCDGRGYVKTPRTVCYEVFRKIRKIRPYMSTKLIVKVNPLVAELLTDEERQGVEELENIFNIKIVVQEDSRFHQEHFEIIQI